MSFFNEYPYRNITDLNLDWLLNAIRTLRHDVDDFVTMNAIKYADPIDWDITRQYEKNTVVIDANTGVAYLSVAPVPSGVNITRPEYWTVVFDLSRFLSAGNSNLANSYEEALTYTATMPTNVHGWILWNGTLYEALNDIHIGDRYVIDGNIKKTTVEDFYNRLAASLTSEIENRIAADTALQQSIAGEAQSRQDADTALQQSIAGEAQSRQDADTALQQSIANEVQARQDADTTLQQSIANEVQARQDADNGMTERINAILNGETAFSTLNAPSTLKFNSPTNHSRYFNYLPYTDPDGNTVNLLTANHDVDMIGSGMYINVLLYGADNTGATDTAAAIQAAIDYASSLPSGGVVYLPAGTYTIHTALRLKDKVSLLGDGMVATYLNVVDSHVGIDCHGSAIGGCFIRGMKIWRNVHDSAPSYPALLQQAGILCGCTVEEYNQAIFEIKDVSIRNFTNGVSGGYYHSTSRAIGLFDSILDNVWCVDCAWAGVALGGSGNQLRHLRIVNCACGIAFIRISDESFDGDLILGGIFIANGYDITFRDAGMYRPIRFINTWFEQSVAGIINVPFSGTRPMSFAMVGCMFNSNTTTYDLFTCTTFTGGIIELENCTAYCTVQGGNNNIVLPATTTAVKGVAVNCVKIAIDGTYMIYEDLT